MKKRKILFVINRFNVGGVEKSLLGLLNALPLHRYEIHVGVIEATGGFLPFVPDGVRVFELPALATNRDILFRRMGALKDVLRRGRFFQAAKMVALYSVAQLSRTLIPFYNGFIIDDTTMPEYDVAVAYQGPSELIDYYVSHYVKAKRKIGWIHFDIDRFYVRDKTVRLSYSAYDNIMIVSQKAKEQFDLRFPEFMDRTEVMLNVIDRESNLLLAQEYTPGGALSGCIYLVTVGRVCSQKAQDKALEAANILKSRAVNFHWTFVGGGEIDRMQSMAKRLGVDDHVTFTGACPNPYPYMKYCDVYVQPSRYEGFCIAIGEAKLFGVPIVATDFVGAHEQLHDVPNSTIIPSPDPAMIADAIQKAAEMGKIEPKAVGIPPQIGRLVEIFG